MKAFVGIRDGNGLCHLYLKDSENLTKIPPDRSQAVYNHLPDGYEWGYGRQRYQSVGIGYHA